MVNSEVPLDSIIQVWNTNRTQQGPAYGFITAGILDPVTKRTVKWEEIAISLNGAERKSLEDVLKAWPADQWNLYWCPLVFTQVHRKKEFVMAPRMLWADIDDAPMPIIQGKGLMPTMLWESSPRRFAGLWQLDEVLQPGDAAALNKALSYAIGADKGGWDLTQVLRVPGTKNHKYEGSPQVGQFQMGQAYRVEDIRRQVQVKPVELPRVNSIPQADAAQVQQLLQKYQGALGERFVKLLFDTAAAGTHDRSKMLWYLDNKMLDAGMQPQEVLQLVKASPWNKYRGRGDEDIRLKAELEKIIENKLFGQDEALPQAAGSQEFDGKMQVDSFKDMVDGLNTTPEWLVEGFWMKGSHGIVAGPPKTMKSTLIMDLAVSVASGRPFLGIAQVMNPGPVIMVQNENSRQIMQDRLIKVCCSKGICGEVHLDMCKDGQLVFTLPGDLPIHFLNGQNFQFDDADKKLQLLELIKQVKPALVIFDPLYLMAGNGDMNSAKDLQPALNWALGIKQVFNCAVIILHHFNKNGQTKRMGQRMLGSTTLHGWVESAWYLDTLIDEADMPSQEVGDEDENLGGLPKSTPPTTIMMEREFRAAGAFPRLEITVSMGEFGEAKYEAMVASHKKAQVSRKEQGNSDLKEMAQHILESNTKPLSVNSISKQLGVGRTRTESIMASLVKEKVARDTPKGFILNRDEAL